MGYGYIQQILTLFVSLSLTYAEREREENIVVLIIA